MNSTINYNYVLHIFLYPGMEFFFKKLFPWLRNSAKTNKYAKIKQQNKYIIF